MRGQISQALLSEAILRKFRYSLAGLVGVLRWVLTSGSLRPPIL